MKSLLTVYVRVLARNGMLSAINLAGLAIGLAGCLLSFRYVSDELSYDSYHENAPRVYRITSEFITAGVPEYAALSSYPLAKELKDKFPEVEEICRFIFGNDVNVKRGDVLFKEKLLVHADPTVFKLFSYQLLEGDAATALAQPGQVVLTQSAARKYFGSEDPLGKTLSINKTDHIVTGVMQDIPDASDMSFDILASMDEADKTDKWFDFSHHSYLLFNAKSVMAPSWRDDFEKKLMKVADDKFNNALKAEGQELVIKLHLQAFEGIHFQKPLLFDLPKGNLNYIYLVALVAIFVLTVACLNYVNFSIAQSIERCKEVGIRKIIGARFSELVVRYTLESVSFAGIALIAAAGLVLVFLPIFNSLTGKSFLWNDFMTVPIMGSAIGLVLIVGVLAGSYPAFFTSSMKPVLALKGKVSTAGGKGLRKTAVAIQFAISIGLIICTLAAIRQMNFIQRFDLGFRKNDVTVVALPADTLAAGKARQIGDLLQGNQAVQLVSICGVGAIPGDEPEKGVIDVKTGDKVNVRMVNQLFVDDDYITALDIKLKDGRYFDKKNAADQDHSVLVNESMVRFMRWKDPIGKKLFWSGNQEFTIIGVVRDFHYRSLKVNVEPQVVIHVADEHPATMRAPKNLIMSYFPGERDKAVEALQKAWSTVYPDDAFAVRYLDDTVQAQYASDDRTARIFLSCSVLAIVISCLGLFGLSSLSIRQRKKEIGIRRIVGAGLLSILQLLAREYVLLVAAAFILVAPLSAWLTNRWLENFTFKEPVGPGPYLFAGFGILILAIFTIGLSVYRISKSKVATLVRDE